ncbi:MAG: hypothetical protein D0531_00225 [Methylococcales bacterium]|nr:MAG: hypothetical protein D0531_00225 [Methylococcales bacterium]
MQAISLDDIGGADGMQGLDHDGNFMQEFCIVGASYVGTKDVGEQDDIRIIMKDFIMQLLDLQRNEIGVWNDSSESSNGTSSAKHLC